MPNQWAQSHLNVNTDTSVSINKYILYILYVKFLYVSTLYAQIYIIVVKLITISNYTRFAYLKNSAVRFSDHVQQILSRYVFYRFTGPPRRAPELNLELILIQILFKEHV